MLIQMRPTGMLAVFAVNRLLPKQAQASALCTGSVTHPTSAASPQTAGSARRGGSRGATGWWQLPAPWCRRTAPGMSHWPAEPACLFRTPRCGPALVPPASGSPPRAATRACHCWVAAATPAPMLAADSEAKLLLLQGSLPAPPPGAALLLPPAQHPPHHPSLLAAAAGRRAHPCSC